MKQPRLTVLSVISVVLAGCVPTLHPVYQDGDLVFEKQLIGVWRQGDSTATWEFNLSEGRTYRLVLTDEDGKASQFEAHLARFDGLTYLDLKPSDAGISGNAFYKAYVLPLHTFLRVDDLGEDTLKLSSVDGGWLKKQLLDHPQSLKHEQMEGGFLVTAPPAELQAFLKSHNETPDAFSQVDTLHRRKGTP